MPNLGALARDSVVYTHAYSNASWTLPSIVSTLTGVFPRYHGTGRRLKSLERSELENRGEVPVGQFRAAWGENYYFFSSYPDQLLTIAERVQRIGYATAAVVSNYLYISSGLASDGFDFVIDSHAVPGRFVNGLALALLEELSRNRPLLLLVHYMDVHQYRFGPKSRGGSPPSGQDLTARYETTVRATDANLAALLQGWERAMGSRESLVAFYSDHGEHLREAGSELSGHGNSMDEVLLHVPLVVRYPASLGVAPGEDPSPVSLVDLVPTVLDALGAPTRDAGLHGTSLLRLERGGSGGERRIFADYQLAGDELSSVRAGHHKLLVNVAADTRELIDTGRISAGVPEAQARAPNRAAESELVEAFEEYARRAAASSSGLKSEQVVDHTELEERLRELGYVE